MCSIQSRVEGDDNRLAAGVVFEFSNPQFPQLGTRPPVDESHGIPPAIGPQRSSHAIGRGLGQVLTEHLQTGIAAHLVNDGATGQRQYLRIDDRLHRNRVRSAGPQQPQRCPRPKLHLLPLINSSSGCPLLRMPGPAPKRRNDFDHGFERVTESGRNAIDHLQ